MVTLTQLYFRNVNFYFLSRVLHSDQLKVKRSGIFDGMFWVDYYLCCGNDIPKDQEDLEVQLYLKNGILVSRKIILKQCD
jgi:hypothetical protein